MKLIHVFINNLMPIFGALIAIIIGLISNLNFLLKTQNTKSSLTTIIEINMSLNIVYKHY